MIDLELKNELIFYLKIQNTISNIQIFYYVKNVIYVKFWHK